MEGIWEGPRDGTSIDAHTEYGRAPRRPRRLSLHTSVHECRLGGGGGNGGGGSAWGREGRAANAGPTPRSGLSKLFGVPVRKGYVTHLPNNSLLRLVPRRCFVCVCVLKANHGNHVNHVMSWFTAKLYVI